MFIQNCLQLLESVSLLCTRASRGESGTLSADLNQALGLADRKLTVKTNWPYFVAQIKPGRSDLHTNRHFCENILRKEYY